MPLHYLGGGSSGSDRSVFALYHRWICYWQRRLLHVYLFLAIFSAYSGDRPFFPSGGWNQNVLHPIFCMQRGLFHLCLYTGKSQPARHFHGVGTSALCWNPFLRYRLHLADRGAKKSQSYRRFPDPQYGILHLGTGRLGFTWTETDDKRTVRMRSDVCGYYSGAAAGEKA